VVIQVIMVAIVITFPGIVTSHVSKAISDVQGTGADELRRQLDAIPGAPSPDGAPKQDEDKEDPAAAIDRMLKQQK
jgi:hypothetical protein